MECVEFYVRSKLDGTDQPSLFFAAEEKGRPLIVGLHTWSYDRHNQTAKLLPLAERLNFNLLLPEFRGPNLDTNPIAHEACGSELAKADIIESLDYVLGNYDVDRENVFLIGGSGGGHMALLIAGYAPERFKAIICAVPITDLGKWAEQSAHYGKHVIACTGGDGAEMMRRSPIAYVDKIAEANLKIYHGKWDGIVPVSHSLTLYNEIVSRHPDSRVYLDIFDGGHEIPIKEIELLIIKQYDKKTVDSLTG